MAISNIRELKTPCYIINQGDYEKNIEEFMKAFGNAWDGQVDYGYSVKTNHLPHMLKTALKSGWKAEVVSPDEYEFALQCGASDCQIIFNGPQKREKSLKALLAGATVNVDNLEELSLICNEISGADCQKVKVGLRVNYNIEKECPGETTCKSVVNRFGISYENGDLKRAIDMLDNAGISLSGLHMHESSSSRSLKIFKSITDKTCEIIEKYELNSLNYIDIGGGFFGGNLFPGKPTYGEYADTICSSLKRVVDSESVTLILEPGAAVLATSMDYLTAVLNIRDIRGQQIVTVDGSVIHINPMMNPHETPFTLIDGGEVTVNVPVIAGSTCMELDRFLPRGLENSVLHESRLLFHACGAYMSTHNSSFINAAPNIYVKNIAGDYELLREKTVESMMMY